MAFVQFHEVVALQNHVIEFQERQRLLALEPQLDAVQGQHAVDGEMPADVAQERDVLELVSQSSLLTIIASVGPSPNVRKWPKTSRMPAILASICVIGEQLPGVVLAGRIADLGGAAAHQHDGLVAGLLQAAQQHDLHQAADMQAVGGGVEADIGRNDA